jgi:hypothetical protein
LRFEDIPFTEYRIRQEKSIIFLSDRKIMEKLLSTETLKKTIENLVGIEKRYYEFLPDECWMTEETQAKGMNIGRTKLRGVKNTLIEEGLLQLEILPNGKRKNLKHKLQKTYPIRLRERGADPGFYARYTVEEEEYSQIYTINWGLLQKYTPEEVNKMGSINRVGLYMDCGFIVLPTHYPIVTENGVKCSCNKALNCSNKGKHPIHRYKHIDASIYESMKDQYLQEFKDNPNLNVGFKVMGYSVLDVDNRHNGDKTLAYLLDEYEMEMKNVLSVQCSNGKHIYASNTYLKNTAGSLGSGLDIRSENGFIVAPGSVHKSGTVYQWSEIGEIATMPDDWFCTDEEENEISFGKNTLDRSNQTGRNQLKDIKLPKCLTPDYVIRDGYRESTLFKWACRERGNGKNASQILDILISIRDNHCEKGEEPMTNDDLKLIADSVAVRYLPNSQK